MTARTSGGVLVIGYGNPLRRDDGLGPHVVDRLAARALPHVRTITAHQLTPEMAEDLAAADAAIFVDASVAPDGDEVQLAPVDRAAAAWSMTHVFEPGTVLGLADMLYGRTPAAWLVRVKGECFDVGEGLSPPARRRAEDALRQIEALLPRYCLLEEP